MILTPLAWFWIGYFSLGIFLLMKGIVLAWDTMDYHIAIKIIGTIIAVAIWPLAFITK
jgi:hypothetical protein